MENSLKMAVNFPVLIYKIYFHLLVLLSIILLSLLLLSHLWWFFYVLEKWKNPIRRIQDGS